LNALAKAFTSSVGSVTFFISLRMSLLNSAMAICNDYVVESSLAKSYAVSWLFNFLVVGFGDLEIWTLGLRGKFKFLAD